MKHKELTKAEKELINGGNNTTSGSTEASIGTDSLLSLNQTYSSGDRTSSHTLEVGKGINIDLGGNLDQNSGN